MAALPRNDPAADGFDAAKLAEACAWARQTFEKAR